MARISLNRLGRYLLRFLLLLLVIIPFIPVIAICMIAAVASLVGCQPDQKNVCLIGSLSVSDVIGWALRSGASFVADNARKSGEWLTWFYVTVGGWLVVSYVLVILGWARTLSRLLLGFAVTMAFAFLPYFGPMLAIANLTHDQCRPNEGYVGPCIIFGGQVGDAAHDAVFIGWLAFRGGIRIALGLFVIYVIVVIVLGVVSAKRRVARHNISISR